MSELYELPEGWEWRKLVETATIANKTVTITDKKYYHCIGLENIESNTGKLIDFTLSNGEDIKSNKVIFEKGMVLYGKLRPYLNKVWTAEFDGIATTEILPFMPIENILNSDFLSHYLRTNYFINNAMKNISGARMPRITTKYLKNEVKIPLPHLQEQKRIVAKLDALFEKIDQAIALHQQNIDEADAFMGSVLNEVFGKNIVTKWKSFQFDKISKFIDYRGKTPKKIGSGTQLITAKNVRFGYLNDEPREYISSDSYDNWMVRGIPKVGDVIFTTEAPLGNVALLNTDEKRVFAQRIITFQALNEDIYNSKFLFYYLMAPYFRLELFDRATGTTVKGIKSSLLKKFKIYLPPLKTQQKTVKYLDQLSAKTEQVKVLQTQKMQSLKDLKASILDRAFRGEM